jgi:predicted Zn-dependent protease
MTVSVSGRLPMRGRTLGFSWALPLLAGIALLGGGCQRPEGEGPGGRQQYLALTPEQELSLGRQAYREILSKYEVLPQNSPKVEQVRRVGSRIVRAAHIQPLLQEIRLHEEGYVFEWEFNVLEDRQINAFCLPGGKVGVFTGLFEVTHSSEDQLAVVLSHEIAHALAHHTSERLARAKMLHPAHQAAGGGLGGQPEEQRRRLIDLLTGLGTLAFERFQESEADHIGIFLMTFAGYDPREAVVFWENMSRASRGGHPPAILSDHPSDAQRIADIEKWVPMALGAKQAYDRGQVVKMDLPLREEGPSRRLREHRESEK